MKILEYVDIKSYSTLKVGGQFRYLAVVENTQDLELLCQKARKENLKIFILGGGSNIIFSDGLIDVLALKIEIKGFEILSAYADRTETDSYMDIKVGAGENWDQIVEKTVEMNLSGLECLSAIPGTVGAGPVQNIGAYGAEVKDTILEVEVYDLKNNIITKLTNPDCQFSYRDSIFKNGSKGQYIITAVTYRLAKTSIPNIPNYPGVKKYFIENNINLPTLLQIRQAIIEIRREKLPDPNQLPNVGSFFKNPIVLNEVAHTIKLNYPEAKFFPIDNLMTKIPAGWLIENAGLKGQSFGPISVYDKNALVLINTKDATADDVIIARDQIVEIVKAKFNIILEQEPEII